MPVLESKLVIRAEDQTKGAFDAIEAHIKSVSQAVASVNRAVGQTGSYVGAAGRAIGAVGNVGRNGALASRGTGGGLGSSIAAAAAGGTFLAARAGEAAIRAVASRQHETARMDVAGETPAEIADAEAQVARLATQFPNVSQTDLLHMLRNARSIVGTYKDAADIAEPLVKLRTLAQLARPGEDVSEDFDKLVKGLEIKGVTQHPKEFQEYMEGIAKGINVFGDTLRPYEYYEMFKYGRQASPGLSEKFILGTGPTLAQELGGEGFGAAVAQFNRLLVSGVGKKGSFEELARLGLIDKTDVADIPGTGEGQGLKAGRTVMGWQLAQSDPNEWVKQYLLPALDNAGIKDKDEQLREIGVLFQSQRAGQLVDLLATQQPRIGKDIALLNNAQGLSAADRAIREDPGLAWTGLKSSIDSLVGATGESVKFAGAVTDAAQAISRFTEDLARRSQTDESVFDITKRKLGWLAAPFNWIVKPGEDPGQAAREKQFRTLNPTGLSGHHIPSSTPGLYEVPPPPSPAAPASLGRDVRSPPSASPQAQSEAVSVTGQAWVQHNVHVDLKIDPLLRVKVDQSTNVLDFTVPLNSGTGRMDSAPAARRAAGIGSM